MSKVVWNGDEDECWTWAASKNYKGYGQFMMPGGRPVGAHRKAYELFVGPIPRGLQIDHLCRNPSCVNPAHLEPVTHRENVLRGNAMQNGAHHRAKTHCPKGHPYSGDNLLRSGRKRHCRACRRETRRREEARQQR